ncbi:MAG: hypothetical protein EZS28_046772, partial [Streblomastix strix]
MIINNAATVIGTNDSYPTFIDLEFLQFGGGTSNIDYGNFTGIQRELVYGQIRATDSSEVTICENHENRSFLYVDFNAVGGQLIFEGGNLSKDINRKFFILASESGIITIENTISNVTFTNIDQIICNDHSTLNIFTSFTYSPKNTSQALIQTFDSTVVIGRASLIDELNIDDRWILNMSSGALNIVSGNIKANSTDQALITTYGTLITIVKRATAIFTTSNVFNISEGIMNIQGGTFIQNSTEHAMITATNATVTFGENSTSIFKAAWGLNVIQGNLNIFGGIFTYKSIKHGMVTATDAMVTIGRKTTPTMTGFNLFNILRGTIYILGGTFNKPSSLELNGTRISITDANATFGDENDANVTPIFNNIDYFNFTGGRVWFYSGQYHGIKSGFRIKSFESQLTFDGKLRQPELYQIQAIKQD